MKNVLTKNEDKKKKSFWPTHIFDEAKKKIKIKCNPMKYTPCRIKWTLNTNHNFPLTICEWYFHMCCTITYEIFFYFRRTKIIKLNKFIEKLKLLFWWDSNCGNHTVLLFLAIHRFKSIATNHRKFF